MDVWCLDLGFVGRIVVVDEIKRAGEVRWGKVLNIMVKSLGFISEFWLNVDIYLVCLFVLLLVIIFIVFKVYLLLVGLFCSYFEFFLGFYCGYCWSFLDFWWFFYWFLNLRFCFYFWIFDGVCGYDRIGIILFYSVVLVIY